MSPRLRPGPDASAAVVTQSTGRATARRRGHHLRGKNANTTIANQIADQAAETYPLSITVTSQVTSTNPQTPRTMPSITPVLIRPRIMPLRLDHCRSAWKSLRQPWVGRDHGRLYGREPAWSDPVRPRDTAC